MLLARLYPQTQCIRFPAQRLDLTREPIVRFGQLDDFFLQFCRRGISNLSRKLSLGKHRSKNTLSFSESDPQGINLPHSDSFPCRCISHPIKGQFHPIDHVAAN